MQCYDAAAASFGWSKRDPQPGSMRDRDWPIGYDCATASYPTHVASATARVTLSADGRARVKVTGQDSGQGSYTALGQTAAHELHLDPCRVEVVMGNSRLPASPGSNNSLGNASLGSAVKLAADQVRARFGFNMPTDEERAAAFARPGLSEISEVGEFMQPGKKPEGLDMLRKGQVPFADQARRDEPQDGRPLR